MARSRAVSGLTTRLVMRSPAAAAALSISTPEKTLNPLRDREEASSPAAKAAPGLSLPSKWGNSNIATEECLEFFRFLSRRPARSSKMGGGADKGKACAGLRAARAGEAVSKAKAKKMRRFWAIISFRIRQTDGDVNNGGIKMKKALMMLGAVLALAGFSLATADHPMSPYKGSAEFEKLKKLAGKWEGTSIMGGKEQKVAVEYQVTSGGSALMEKLMPGTPHEMVSMYYEKGGKPRMTHFCMLYNRPELELKSAKGNDMNFELAKGGEVKTGEAHMHALTTRWVDDDHFTQKWTSYEGGKPKETSTFNFTRVK